MKPATALTIAALAFTAALGPLQGCVSNDYVGERYAPTDHVRVFYDGAIPEGYRAVGRDRAEATDMLSTEQIVQEMIKKAQEVGADAMAVTGVDTVEIGSSTSTYGRDKDTHEYYATADGELHRKNASSGEWSSNSYTTVQKNKVVTATFLKRN